MKVLVTHEKLERLKRNEKYAEFVRSNDNVSAMAPCLERLVEVNSMEKGKNRIWHIEEDKQLLKVQVHNNGHNGQKVFAEGGSMLYMGGKIELDHPPLEIIKERETNIPNLLLKILINEYKGEGEVAFAGSVPGEFAAILIKPGERVIAQRNAWVAGIGDLKITLDPQKLDAGTIFGVEDLFPLMFFNKGTDDGYLFFHACGGYELICLKEGKTIKAEVGSVVAREKSVTLHEQISSIKSGLFGGEGMFMIELKGPGLVILQTTNVSKIQSLMKEYVEFGMPPFMLMNLASKGVRKIMRDLVIGRSV